VHCSVYRKTLPRAATVSGITDVRGRVTATKPSASTRETVKSSLASWRNVNQSAAGLKSSVSQKTEAGKPLYHQPRSESTAMSSRTLSRKQPLPANKSPSVSHDRMSNQRCSVTSQFKSAGDRRRAVQLPATGGHPQSAGHSTAAQPQSASDRRKAYLAQLKTGRMTTGQAPVTTDQQIKSVHTHPNSKKKVATVEVPQLQSCRDRRKSYQAELVVRQKAVLAASKKPAVRRHSSTAAAAAAGNNKPLQASSSKLAGGFRISTPSTSKRTAATVTPSLSCIPRHKTVSFVTPASHKCTPQLHRTQPVKKEMSMRCVVFTGRQR